MELTSERMARFRFQMLSKSHREHVVYVLVKFVVPKVPWSVVSSLLWLLSLEKIPSLSETYQNEEVEMDDVAINRSEAEIVLLLLHNRLPFSEVILYPLL